jgi:tRNA pseudouridine38-40 synthase
MSKIKMAIEYDGTNYRGWQRQKKGKSIQATIEEVLSKILKSDIKIRGSGRTDAGVHALGQVATFNFDLKFSLDILKKAINANLPPDIRVVDLEEVDESFHPQYDVKKKSYIYYLCIDEDCSCFLKRYVWHYPIKLDLSIMNQAKEILIGTMNFQSFSGSTDVKNKIRTVYQINLEFLNKLSFMDMELKGSFIKFRIEADGFLKYMARNIVGFLIEIGRGALTIDTVKETIKKGERPTPLRTAPPQGLFLERIVY